MELIRLSAEIQKKIKQLEDCRAELRTRSEDKARTIREYDKEMAKKIIEMKEAYPATLCEKLAKGACFQQRYDMELAEAMFKSLNTAINSIQAP